jgi:hypothetical protein
MEAVGVLITKWLGVDPQPGIVECRLTDAWGKEWTFIDKVPIFTADDLDERSKYPRPGSIRCTIVRRWRDHRGREIITVSTQAPDGVEATSGETSFDVLPSQLVDFSVH